MNKFVEFTVYGLQFKGNRSSGRRRAERGVASGTASGFLNRVVRCLILAVLLLGASLPAMGQAVIMNGDYYLTHNEAGNSVNAAATTTFNPATCLWAYAYRDYIRTANSSGEAINNNNNYLQNSTTVSLGTDWGSFYRGNNNENIRYRAGYYNTSYYLRLNGTTWQFSTTNNNNGALYDVTITPQAATSTNPTINGADVLTETGNSTYTATGAAYRAAYTNYYFRTANHYFDANGNSFTGAPANATLTYAWNLADNAYATVNNSGVVTVTSLPEYDITLTLTVTATATGGTPAAPANTTLTGTKEITIQGTMPSAPIISVSGSSATITTDAAGSTTIRYTLDGTNPTASTGTVYSGTIDLTTNGTSPVTIKAVTVRNGNASDVSSEVVTLTLPEPTITINGDAGTASITSSVAGATIYYTTDGTTPTTSSSQFTTTLPGLAFMTTVKAIAVKDGWNNSPVASGIVTIPSGVGGGVVTLFDYEPHSWSYYSDPDCPVRSLSPADVKITYYGDGIVMSNNDDYTAGTNNYVSPGDNNYVGGAKVNVGGENENTFVYYKTLERGANTDDPWTFSSGNQSSAASRCPYTPIPNPFQVRPTYGERNVDANDFTGWRGFQCWRLKRVSGGAVYSASSGGSALSVGAIINAETEIYFAPNSEYGMEVDLEAVWARAYLIKGNNGNENGVLSQNVGVERNFMTLISNGQTFKFNGTSGRRITNLTYPVTISCYYPNGEAPDYTNSTVRGNDNNITLLADTKFENVGFYNMTSYTLTANGHDLTIGRGCTGTINLVRGINDDVSNPNYHMRLESGTYNYVSFTDGYYTNGNQTVNGQRTISGTMNVRTTFGCDYDRANNQTTLDGKTINGITDNLIVNYAVFLGHNNTINGNNSNETSKTWVKSGKIGNGFTINNSYTAAAHQTMYLGVSSTSAKGLRSLYIEGGQLASIAGGIDSENQGESNNHVKSFYVRMINGHIRGVLYGGGARSPASGDRDYVITGGTITGWLGAGCNGEAGSGSTYAGQTHGESTVYFGGTAKSGGTGSNVSINGSTGGVVFGAGKGVQGNTSSGQMTYGTTVVVADECDIERNVYGGGNYGYAQTSTTVYVSGGTVHGSVFGGSNQNDGPAINIKMIGGLIEGGLYGGSNTTGTIDYNVEMHINGGQVGTSSSPANIHGGGYGQPTRVSQNVDITLGSGCNATEGVTVYGDVYGGSALGYVNGTTATNDYHTYVTLNKGTIYGSLYGGGLGNAGNAANVYGPVQVKVFGGSVKKTDANGANGSGAVYGCNNISGAPQRAVSVDIYGTDPAPSENEYALFAVYGGGNQADYSYGTPTVTVHNCNNSIEYVYGGGNAAHITNGNTDVTIYGGNKIGNVFGGGNGTVTAANVSGDTDVKIYGGTIGKVFGGSNSRGTIGGTINVTAETQTESGTDPCSGNAYQRCPIQVGELYGGGNQAPSNVGRITIGCMNAGDMIDYVYGGSNDADITGDVALTMTGGRVGNLFGGNNTGHSISGTIIVNVEWDGSCSNNYLGNVYGGGNLASYSGSPAVNIKNGTVSQNVYGGGKGNTAVVTGSPAVTIGDANGSHSAIVGGDVYGGGDAAAVTGATSVVYNDANATSSVGRLFGGGNAAGVSSTATVTLTNGKVTGGIYGGCNATGSVGAVTVALNGGTVGATGSGNEADVYGGGFGAATTTTGNIGVTLNGATVYGDLYGGSALGSVNASTSNTTTVTLTTATLHGSIFGGGKGDNASLGGGHSDVTATSEGKAIVNINVYDQYLTGIYGGANVRGLVKGDITVNVNANVGATGAGNSLDIFGGGYGANTATNGNVTVNVGAADGSIVPTIYGDIYGGSALGSVNDAVADLTTVNINNGTIHGDVYGGGLGDATVLPNGYLDPDAPKVEAIEYGTVHVNIGTSEQLSNSVVIDGKVFGCNNLAGTPKGHVYVDVYHTAHTAANSYPSPEPATVAAIADQTAYAISEVYGGGNLAHYSTTLEGASTHVHVHNCDNTIQYVYGGGNAANTQANAVRVDGGRMLYVFGGGNGAGSGNPGANVAGNASVTLGGGIIDYVFGGSNTLGMVNGTTSITFTSPATCTRLIKELYGGGNLAPGGAVNMTLPCGTTGPDIVFGGSKNADIGTEGNPKNINLTIAGGDYSQVFGGNNQGGIIWGNVTLTLVGGTIRDAFGGNNQGGNVKGTITVNVEDAENVSCPLQVDNVYGGGNQAAYTPSSATITSPKVNILHGTVNNAVFGGGLGVNAGVTANPQVTIGDAENGSHSATVGATKIGGGSGDGYVFGGGSEAVVHKNGANSGNTHVILTGNAHVTGNVYGGGNQADVEGNSHVEMR